MSVLEPWNLVFVAGFVVYVGIRHVYIARTQGEKKTIRRVDGLEKTLLLLVMVSSLLLPVVYLFSPLLAFADYRPPAPLPWLGAVLMVLALVLFSRSHADLGQNWSVSLEVREGHELVTHGVYRFIRHPMYAAIGTWNLGQGLLLANWLAGWSASVMFALLYFVRMPREERLMLDEFGEAYREYMHRTGRVFPHLWTRKRS